MSGQRCNKRLNNYLLNSPKVNILRNFIHKILVFFGLLLVVLLVPLQILLRDRFASFAGLLPAYDHDDAPEHGQAYHDVRDADAHTVAGSFHDFRAGIEEWHRLNLLAVKEERPWPRAAKVIYDG